MKTADKRGEEKSDYFELTAQTYESHQDFFLEGQPYQNQV